MTTVHEGVAGLQYEDGRSPSPMAEAMIQMLDQWPTRDLAAIAAAAAEELGHRTYPGIAADISTLNDNFLHDEEGFYVATPSIIDEASGVTRDLLVATWTSHEGTMLAIDENGCTPEQAGMYAATIIRTLAAVAS